MTRPPRRTADSDNNTIPTPHRIARPQRQTRSTTTRGDRLGLSPPRGGSLPEVKQSPGASDNLPIPSRFLEPPNIDDSIVYKALLLELPQVPKSFSFAQKSSTNSRAPVEEELTLDHKEQLEKVVPCWGIMSKLIVKLREALKSRHQPLESDPFMYRLTIDSRCAHLPSRICGEHDTEDWVHSAILRPAIAVLQYLLNNNTSTRKFPNISSVGGPAPIPDGVMFKISTSRDNALITIEFKTHNVLGDDWLQQIDQVINGSKTSVKGSAIKFVWPGSAKKLGKPTKVLVQLWGQMLSWKVEYMILSSYRHTYFFFKPKDRSNTLYITNDFRPGDVDLLPATVSFMALALGLYSIQDLDLPPADTNHWATVCNGPGVVSGLDPRTFLPPIEVKK
ncbi:hypothetical protein CCMSSC00406_0006092 [Pleurotus cornucopiae]|uniref:Uncharacterized protein n=1 Tax=Pleurotus cornucopiae TaxID=5321 RepID=A0ACB7J9X7_PLECO|nr:hypothetical protein CCMSSC00406_0006092 [Pleurotus cornucopiae]